MAHTADAAGVHAHAAAAAVAGTKAAMLTTGTGERGWAKGECIECRRNKRLVRGEVEEGRAIRKGNGG